MGHQKHARKFPRNQAAVAPGEVADRGDLEPGQARSLVAAFTVVNGRIVAIDIIADPDKLRGLDLG